MKYTSAATIAGAVLTATGIALAANVIWVLSRLAPSGRPFDTCYVLPSPWIIIVVFGLGAVGDLLFRRQAQRLGKWAAWIWRTHLLLTAGLLATCLIAGVQGEITQRLAIMVYVTYPLMLFAHGLALTAGAVVVRGLGGHA